MSNFTKNVMPYVDTELKQAYQARLEGKYAIDFSHLENAHVIGQESTLLHVKVHWLMLRWAIRNSIANEVIGQCFRIIGAATKTALGLVPSGNTGGANISPFKAMPIKPEFAEIISKAKRKA